MKPASPCYGLGSSGEFLQCKWEAGGHHEVLALQWPSDLGQRGSPGAQPYLYKVSVSPSHSTPHPKS